MSFRFVCGDGVTGTSTLGMPRSHEFPTKRFLSVSLALAAGRPTRTVFRGRHGLLRAAVGWGCGVGRRLSVTATQQGRLDAAALEESRPGVLLGGQGPASRPSAGASVCHAGGAAPPRGRSDAGPCGSSASHFPGGLFPRSKPTNDVGGETQPY